LGKKYRYGSKKKIDNMMIILVMIDDIWVLAPVDPFKRDPILFS
jgi:hypothetical protein